MAEERQRIAEIIGSFDQDASADRLSNSEVEPRKRAIPKGDLTTLDGERCGRGFQPVGRFDASGTEQPVG